MAFVIALSGKGGTGKTALAALMIRHLTRARGAAVLAVDADPNSCLGATLGIEPERTIADIREDARGDRLGITAGMSKGRQIEYLIQASVAEGNRFDLLTMGRPEGPKCYCYVNTLLRKYLEEVTTDYPFVVMDNEAGMEHLSRRTTNNVDHLLIASEATVQAARAADRIMKIGESLPITVKHKHIVVNRVADGEDCSHFEKAVRGYGYAIALRVPLDQELHGCLASGRSIFDVPESSSALRAVGAFLDGLVEQGG